MDDNTFGSDDLDCVFALIVICLLIFVILAILGA